MTSACQVCSGSSAIDISIVAGIGRPIYHVEENYRGPFCRSFGLELYEKVLSRHLKNTWFSPSALLFGSTIGANRNLRQKSRLESLPVSD